MRIEIPLYTGRLTLEPLDVTHASLMYSGFADQELYGYLPHDAPGSLDELKARFLRVSAGENVGGTEKWLNWAVRLNVSVRDYVGTVQSTILQSRVAIIAYMFFPQFSNCGYAREAVCEMLQFLFRECGVRRAEAHIDTRNMRSIRLVEALGFSRGGIIKGADYFKGSSSDEYCYVLVNGSR